MNKKMNAVGYFKNFDLSDPESLVGDEVYYAGDITRSGGNAQFHLVDSRIVGLKPKDLDFEKAAAMPLTAITAWELIFDRLSIQSDEGGSSVLVMAGDGGVVRNA